MQPQVGDKIKVKDNYTYANADVSHIRGKTGIIIEVPCAEFGHDVAVILDISGRWCFSREDLLVRRTNG